MVSITLTTSNASCSVCNFKSKVVLHVDASAGQLPNAAFKVAVAHPSCRSFVSIVSSLPRNKRIDSLSSRIS